MIHPFLFLIQSFVSLRSDFYNRMKSCVSISNDIFFLFEQGGIKTDFKKGQFNNVSFFRSVDFVEFAKNRLI